MTLNYAIPPVCRKMLWQNLRKWIKPTLLLCCLILVAGAVYLLTPRVIICHESADRIKSGANLRQIGQAARQYALDFGEYPDSLATLVFAPNDLAPAAFVSPMCTDTPAPSFPVMLSKPGHLSYVWVGGGLSMTGTPDHVVGYQRITSWNLGASVLYSDGSVKYLGGVELQEAIRSVQARLGMPAPDAPPLPPPSAATIAPSAPATSPE